VNRPYASRCRLLTDIELPTGKLPVAVRCRVGDIPGEDVALLDTASTWCVLPPNFAPDLEYEPPVESAMRLDTRFGLMVGELIRLPVTFVPDEGEPTTVEATWFLSADWPGPLVIGWKGCLERMRFACEPDIDAFHCEPL